MIVGIDPGFSGAVALVDDVMLWEVVPMPITDDEIRRVDGAALATTLYEWQTVHGVSHAVVERVASRPGQGVVSTFNFGMSYGVVLGVLDAFGFDISYVRPQDWKKHFNLGSDKTESRAVAVDLWPDFVSEFARVKDDGKAEAALIAMYGEQR